MPTPMRYRTTSEAGLQSRHPALRLFQKSKKLGCWDPYDVDLTQDRRDWLALNDDERDALLNLSSLFQAGEEAVTIDLLPMIRVMAQEGRIEEEMYLTSFLFEEAKHVETFHRFLTEVACERRDLDRFQVPSYRQIFDDELPTALGRLESDHGPEAMAIASVTYNMIVEGVLAETGYHGYHQMLQGAGLMPGMQTLISHTKRDESRHVAYGVFLLSRLVAEHGEPLWLVIESELNRLVTPAMMIIVEGLAKYDPIPFGLELDELSAYAASQYQARVRRIEQARRQTLDEVMRNQDDIDQDASTVALPAESVS